MSYCVQRNIGCQSCKRDEGLRKVFLKKSLNLPFTVTHVRLRHQAGVKQHLLVAAVQLGPAGISFRTSGLLAAAVRYGEVVNSWPVFETAVEFRMARAAAMEPGGMPQRAAAAAAAWDWMDCGVRAARPAAVCLRAGCIAASEAWQLTAAPQFFLRSGWKLR